MPFFELQQNKGKSKSQFYIVVQHFQLTIWLCFVHMNGGSKAMKHSEHVTKQSIHQEKQDGHNALPAMFGIM